MKKLSLIALTSFILVGCATNSSNDYENLRIITPTGAPAVALSYFCDYENFETVTDPNKILPLMSAGNADVVVLPTNVGAKAIHEKGLPYKILGTLTFGNFYLASTGNDKNGILDTSDYIVSFQQGAVPDKIFHYVHGNEYDNTLHYVSGVQEAAKCLKLGKNLTDDNNIVDYVLLAEPVLTTVINSTPGRTIYENLQESYKVKSDGYKLFQASIFISNDVDKVVIKEHIQKKIELSINEILTTEGTVNKYMNKIANPEVVFGVTPEIAQKVTSNNNGLGLGFEYASENIEGINKFLSLFGDGGLTDEEIFK